MDALDRVKKLVERAVHSSTPEEEARTCAVKALQLLTEHKLEIVDPNAKGKTSNTTPWEDVVMQGTEAWKEVPSFRVTRSMAKGKCVACKTEIPRNEMVARVFGKGDTHYRCRRYWIDGLSY